VSNPICHITAMHSIVLAVEMLEVEVEVIDLGYDSDGV
jgi:hypothetical protein